ASIDSNGDRSPGGLLAQKRDEFHLSQATLGGVDPTSQTMALGALGRRGAAVVVWGDAARKCQMREDWNGLKPVVAQITRVQSRGRCKERQEGKGRERADSGLGPSCGPSKAQARVDSGPPLRVSSSGEQEARRNKPAERAPTPLLFHPAAATAQRNYAETID